MVRLDNSFEFPLVEGVEFNALFLEEDVVAEGICRTTLSCRSTNDSFGREEPCFHCARLDVDGALLVELPDLDVCHAFLDAEDGSNGLLECL